MTNGTEPPRQIALVTGASSGIGFELARLCARNGFDLIVAADEPEIHAAGEMLREKGVGVEVVETGLDTVDGVDRLMLALDSRPVAAVLANAGRGLGGGFVDQRWTDVRRVIDTNVTETTYLLHKLAPRMKERGAGRILITGSIAGFMPGTYQAVYNASKAFLDSFSFALRHELKGSGVTVTCLMPGATETEFFERAGMMDTSVGQADKDDAAMVARKGFEAMMAGEGDVVTGWQSKLQAAIAHITPAGVLAELHRKMAAPGSAG